MYYIYLFIWVCLCVWALCATVRVCGSQLILSFHSVGQTQAIWLGGKCFHH